MPEEEEDSSLESSLTLAVFSSCKGFSSCALFSLAAAVVSIIVGPGLIFFSSGAPRGSTSLTAGFTGLATLVGLA